jgi:protein-S-isoprenylcysteine O-methyltransferase Ste14
MKSMESERPRGAGLSRLLFDLRHRRERFRQFLGIVLVMLLSFAGTPQRTTYLLGLLPFAIGAAIRLWASGHVKKDAELATDGPYAFVRHPLYVGNILLLLGFCLASGLWWSWPLGLLFLLAFYPPAIRQEDAKLERLFGEKWRSWRAGTSALIPRLTPFGRSGGGAWSFRQSLMSNGEPVIAAFLCVLMFVLQRKLP